MSFRRPYHKAFREDPYYQKDYHQCYLHEGEEVFDFEEREGSDFFLFRSIKRPIRTVGNQKIEGPWFDLESVYGFGGYITNSSSSAFVQKALYKLKEKCLSENVVAHFMRFHPLNSFPIEFEDFLSFKTVNRKVIFVDVHERSYEEVRTDYSSSLKRNINKAERMGLEAKELNPSEKVREEFMSLYYSTMERKEADQMYFFSKDYFFRLFKTEKLKVYATFFQDTLISMILALDSGEGEVYYHLGATHGDFYSYNPNPFILDQIVQQVQRSGGKFLFLGGGNSDDEADPLFRFKKKFSKEQQEFYIGGSIFHAEKFKELKSLAKELKPDLPPLFLSYRFV